MCMEIIGKRRLYLIINKGFDFSDFNLRQCKADAWTAGPKCTGFSRPPALRENRFFR